MAFIAVNKATAAEVYGGTSWTVDHANFRIVEGLGRARPAFHFGDVYSSLAEAKERESQAAGLSLEEYEVARLADLLRIPMRTPVPGGRFIDDRQPPSRAWVLIAGDILSNGGLRLEERRIVSVDFAFAPHCLSDLCDVVASAVTLEGDSRMKVGVDYSRDGEIRADTAPALLTDSGSIGFPSATVFFSRTQAVAAADDFQKRLETAADWRANSGAPGMEILSQAA